MADATSLSGAVLTLLKTLDPAVLDAGVGEVPAGPYYSFYDSAPRTRAGRLSTGDRAATYLFRLVCVGRDANEARHVVQQAVALLHGRRLDPADRAAGPLQLIPESAPIIPDRDVRGQTRYSQTLAFVIHYQRGPS